MWRAPSSYPTEDKDIYSSSERSQLFDRLLLNQNDHLKLLNQKQTLASKKISKKTNTVQLQLQKKPMLKS